jgi:orotidine-5'-phosphate decarboxylase
MSSSAPRNFSPLHFGDRLTAAIIEKRTPLVVGIDPRLEQLPAAITAAVDVADPESVASAFAEFGIAIIDIVKDLVPAVKPQAAFFEQLGPLGMAALAEVVDHASDAGLLVVMDAKRGDIGSTADAYAKAYLGHKSQTAWGCDCLTINPYMGFDTLEPFFNTAQSNGAGLFILCKTSNPGSDALQEQVTDGGEKIHQRVADEIQRLSFLSKGGSGYGIAGAVVGATYPQQLAELRQQMPNSILLVPGFGAQGGTASDVAGAFDENGLGAIINSSRGIIFAYEQERYSSQAKDDWKLAIKQATMDTIEVLAAGTNAQKLV